MSARAAATQLTPAQRAFFESPDGVQFLRVLLTAALFVMNLSGGLGVALVRTFFTLTGLHTLVACSESSLRKTRNAMIDAIGRWGDTQDAALAAGMDPKEILVGFDENFHRGMTLVAMEATSGFLLVEKAAERRDAKTWAAALREGIRTWPVKIVGLIGDEAKGLIRCALQELGVLKGSDLFHVQYEIGRGVSGPLGRLVRTAEKARIDALRYDVRGLVDLEHSDIFRPGDIHENALRAIDRKFKKRTVDRRPSRILGTRLSRGDSDSHESGSAVLHDRPDIREVDIDDTRLRDEIGNSLDSLSEHVVDYPERVYERRLLIDDGKQFVVRDGDEGIDPVAEIRKGLLADRAALRALEGERLGHDADRKRSELLGRLGDDRRGTGSGSAPESARHEDHVRSLEHLLDLVPILFGCLTTDFRIHTGTKPLREVLPDMDLLRRLRIVQRLGIGIYHHELDPLDIGIDHSRDGVSSGASDADHLDLGEHLYLGFDFCHRRMLLRE